MFLQPSQKKYKKERKGIISGIVFESLNSGTYGIVSLECAKINARQIEMARRVISKRIKSIGKL
jgi:large subunit ribosomal protein L16